MKPIYIYLGKYSSNEPWLSDEDTILKNFEVHYGDKSVSLKNRLDFARIFSKNSKYSKEFILDVLKCKKN
jgi:hypothetical protein